MASGPQTRTFAKKSAGSDMVGTPRGYVKKKDIERVDREMTPILEDATGALAIVIPSLRAARTGAVMYRGAKALKKGTEAIQRAKTASGPVRRFAPKGAKQVVKEAPKKSDGTNKVLAGLGGVTAVGYGASKMFPARKGETAGSYPARKPGGARPETPGSYPASRPAAPKSPPASFETAYQSVNRKHGTDKPVTSVRRAIPIPKAKPAMDKSRVAGKSKTRKAFEQEFAKQRKAGKKDFTFRGKKYTTKLK
jgi:hypothetical protein